MDDGAIVRASSAELVEPVGHQLTPSQLRIGKLLAIGTLTGLWTFETFDTEPRVPQGLAPRGTLVNLARAWVRMHPREWDEVMVMALEQSPERFEFHKRALVQQLLNAVGG